MYQLTPNIQLFIMIEKAIRTYHMDCEANEL
jgi:hypothetical protein